MIMRKNKVFEKLVRKGIEMSKGKHYRTAEKMLVKAGIPYIVVDRVLYEPHNVRSTD